MPKCLATKIIAAQGKYYNCGRLMETSNSSYKMINGSFAN